MKWLTARTDLLEVWKYMAVYLLCYIIAVTVIKKRIVIKIAMLLPSENHKRIYDFTCHKRAKNDRADFLSALSKVNSMSGLLGDLLYCSNTISDYNIQPLR